MATKIFVNLPVKNLQKSIEFFTALGFSFNPQFTDDKATCMVISDAIFAMLLVEERFKDFTKMPTVPHRLKEWAYAGFTFAILSACISHWAIDGAGVQTFFPLMVSGVLAISYFWYHKLQMHTQTHSTYNHFANA